MIRSKASTRKGLAVIVLLGLCLGKPPGASPCVQSPSYDLPRDASSYVPRKQQRSRVTSPRSLPAPTAGRGYHRARAADLVPPPRSAPEVRSLPLAAPPVQAGCSAREMMFPLRC